MPLFEVALVEMDRVGGKETGRFAMVAVTAGDAEAAKFKAITSSLKDDPIIVSPGKDVEVVTLVRQFCQRG